jgi:lipoyl(octanoyl) transferase
MHLPIDVIDLGRVPYADAYAEQCRHHERILAARAADAGPLGAILLLEHEPPVITISRRPGARAHLLASDEQLRLAGVTLAHTDRGGDITYHGPGQLVVYPILDLHRLRIHLHDYMRLLESAVIDACAAFGLAARRDPAATGVWVRPVPPAPPALPSASLPAPADADATAPAAAPPAKVCAMGVRVRRWVTLHGLALNVSTNLDHFSLIVPCGLAGRAVTSLLRELGERCPSMAIVKSTLADSLLRHLAAAAAAPPRLNPASGPSSRPP